MTPQACTECNRYRKALALILALIARSAGGLVAEIHRVAQEAMAPDGANEAEPLVCRHSPQHMTRAACRRAGGLRP